MGIVLLGMRKLTFMLCLVVTSMFLLVPTPAHAFFGFDPAKIMEDSIISFINHMISDFASQAFNMLGEYVISLTDIKKIPSIDTFMSWSKLAAASLATIFFVKRLGEALRDELTGENTPNIAEIIGSYVIALVLTQATPYIITKFIIPINNYFIQSVTSLGINVKLYQNFVDVMVLDESWAITFMLLVWVIAFLAFSIVAAIRYVDLAIVLIMGPLIATSYTNRSQVYATYWIEVVSVVFIQSVHIVLAYFIIQWASDASFMGLIFSLAAIIVSLRGPQVIRQFLYQSGTGGMMSGAGRMAAYRFMMKGVGK